MTDADSESNSEPESDVPVTKRTKRTKTEPVPKSNDVKPTVAPSKQKGIQKGILQDLPNMPLDIIDEVGLCSFYVDIQVRMKRLTQWDHDRFFHIWN